MPQRKKAYLKDIEFVELSAVDRPAQEGAVAEFTKADTSEEDRMEGEQKAQAEELAKRDKEIESLRKQIAQLEKPAPTVLMKMEDGTEITTDSPPEAQALAKRVKTLEFEKTAGEVAPHVDTEVAVGFLEVGKKAELEKLEELAKQVKTGESETLKKQAEAFTKAGLTLKGEVQDQDIEETVAKSDDPQVQVQAFMKAHPEVDAYEAALAVGRMREQAAAH